MARRVAVVFGGTGFIGAHVVQRLARRDYVVRVVTRAPEAARTLMTQGMVGQIVPVTAGAMDAAALHRAVEGAEVVVNLIGILSERRAGDFARLHGTLPGRIAGAAAAAGVTHLVQVSAIGADPSSPSLYARSKAEGEAAVLAAFPRATILRPSVVFGPEDSFFNRFAGLARILPVLPLVGGNTRFQPVYVGDVADAVMATIDQPAAAGRTYELAGPRAATFRSLLQDMLHLIGRRRPIVEMPVGLASFQAKLTSWLPNPPLTEDQILLLKHDNVPSGTLPGLAELGITPTSMEAILPSYLTRFREGGGRRAVIPG
ncbi:complex I NDUFA9 subunit family protein [Muricoccus aerilatus]|uniref:complex I NDUFA9 subunit family protein n=1 Tax=Muricoccus aerilatus TaxID=452982 RepID=UPI0005C19D02|nr:complex I NDUFA9 subunit family protein [Roseomonas aerilata]